MNATAISQRNERQRNNSPDLHSPDSIQKPRKIVVPLAVGLAWTSDPDYIYQEKLDGRFETRRVFSGKSALGVPPKNPIGETILAGENMRGAFYAFDLLTLHGEDCRNWPLRERLAWLDQIFQTDVLGTTGDLLHRVPTLNLQPSTLNEIWARGGEGIVRKRLDSPWGTPMEACKRLETFYCQVTGINPGQSVRIARCQKPDDGSQTSDIGPLSSDLRPCGSVKLGGGKADRIRVGSIIKVEGFGLTAAGMIREPRPCKDTPTSWLVQF